MIRNKRVFDISLAIILFLIFFLPGLIIAFLVKFTSRGPAIYHSERIGIHNKTFLMPKFRTMHSDTPAVATHLLNDPGKHITFIGKFLRKFSLDEIPQLISILKGDMSFVGPRPALFNQSDLIQQRTNCGIDQIIPGLTGWAQINGRDELTVVEKVNLDKFYYENQSFLFDLKIILLTVFKVFIDKNISH